MTSATLHYTSGGGNQCTLRAELVKTDKGYSVEKLHSWKVGDTVREDIDEVDVSFAHMAFSEAPLPWETNPEQSLKDKT